MLCINYDSGSAKYISVESSHSELSQIFESIHRGRVMRHLNIDLVNFGALLKIKITKLFLSKSGATVLDLDL